MFDKLLIANRGEIACRVIRTARRLGIGTVAVYSDADAEALHVHAADEAYRIGPPPAAESYLNADAIVAAAQASGAEAIHPGYGFLSENADFAEACAAAGVVFVGPPPDAIRAMGSKSAAKAIMEKAGVPLVPGYHGAKQDKRTLKKAAADVGYPVLIKASAGGGGRGMRRVDDPADFDAALDSAKREAAGAFGDDQVLIEKYHTRPRHVEIQVFADTHGNAVHLFERDCSIQRRHQKVIEEAPAPGLGDKLRAAMGQAAVQAAKAIGYAGAGTVEFIYDGADGYYFMEMNTRLQVEHPVTELITGVDLVEWQLRVAAGEVLPLDQDALAIGGHAIEARVYAEDAARDFLPATGRLLHLYLPDARDHIRVDSGVVQGDVISPHYDPMIAKVIAWGPDRDVAATRLHRALTECRVVGTVTNVALLARIVGHPAFRAAELDTGFVERHANDLLAPSPTPAMVPVLAALHEELERARAAARRAAASTDRYSPWHFTDGWRLNDDAHHRIDYRADNREIAVVVHYRAKGYEIECDGERHPCSGRLGADGTLIATAGDRRLTATVVRDGDMVTVFVAGETHALTRIDALAAHADQEVPTGSLTAPMSGKVIRVLANAGDRAKRGAPLLIMEAMKMEHTIAAPAHGTVGEVYFAEGEQVDEGAELLSFEADGAA